MEWLDDSKACLNVSESMLKDIDVLIQDSLKDVSVLPYLKVKIKNLLENCRSPLDYAANYIFDTYCKTEYTEKELRKKKTYFPIRKQESLFDVCIRDDFRKLSHKRNDLVGVMKKFQPFNGDPWLNNLTVLINENKHRNLTKQSKRQNGQIGYMEDIMGNTFIDCTFENVGAAIMINGRPFDPSKPNPYIKHFSGNVETYFMFSEINQPVLNTLKDIYSGSNAVITEFENLV